MADETHKTTIIILEEFCRRKAVEAYEKGDGESSARWIDRVAQYDDHHENIEKGIARNGQ